MRQLTARVKAALRTKPVRPAVLAYIDHPDGALYYWNGTGTLTYNGNDYLGVGLIGGVRGVQSTSELRISQTELFVSGVPESRIDDLSGQLRNREATIDVVLLDERGDVIPDPIRMATITLDNDAVQVDGNGMVTFAVSGQQGLWQLERALAVSWTKEEQEQTYSGDTGFDMIPDLADRQVTWTLT